MREITHVVEAWDAITGSWYEVDEHRRWNDGVAQVHALQAQHPDESYRVVSTTTVTYGPKAGS